MEQKKVFWLDGRRMTPGNKNEPNSFKVRRAKVGGYRDYFSEEQLAEMANDFNTVVEQYT